MLWDRLSDGETLAQLVYGLILVTVLVGALVARSRARRGSGRAFRHATIWVFVAAVLLIAYSLKDEAAWLMRRVGAELMPQAGFAEGGTIAFRAGRNGHFVVEADVDGTKIVFLVDSGATDVVLSPADARRLAIDIQALRFDKTYRTANGLVRGAPVRLGRVSIGPIALTDVRASVNGAPMETSLLGMSFLSRLSSWRVEGDRLTLVQ